MENNNDELPGQLTGVRLPGMTARQAIFTEAESIVEKYKDILAPHEIVTFISVNMGLGHGKALQYYTDVIRNNGIQYKLDNPEKYIESLKKIKVIPTKKEELSEDVKTHHQLNRMKEKEEKYEEKQQEIPEETTTAGSVEEPYEPEKDEYTPSPEEELSPKIEKKPAENQTSILIKPKKTQEQFKKECQEISKEQLEIYKSRDPTFHIPFENEPEWPVFNQNMISLVHTIWLKRNPGYIITAKPGYLGTISYPDIS